MKNIIPIKIRPHGEFAAYIRKSPGRKLTPQEIMEFYKEIKAGKCKQVAKEHNLITNIGRTFLGNVLAAANESGGNPQVLEKIKYGNGTDTPILGDEDLKGSTVYENDSFSAVEGTGTAVVDFLGYIAYSSGNDLVISEAGIYISFYAAWDPNLFARCLFTNPWTKTDEQDAMIIYTLTLSAV